MSGKTDVISRQAAIDAVEHITSSMSVCVNTDECHGMKRMQRQAVIELANLPSAQPELSAEDRQLIKKLRSYHNGSYARVIDKLIASAQSEIIRCGQCRYAKVADAEDNQDGYTCQFHQGSIWFSGSFCSWAERREVTK